MATPNREYSEIPRNVTPDVPYQVNKIVNEIDLDVQALEEKVDQIPPPTWSNVQGKPSTFPATSHTHPLSQIHNTELITGRNLNEYTSAGYFHQSQNAEALLTLNYPVELAGQLTVLAENSFVYQIYHAYGSSNRIYTRTRYNSTWYGWKEVSTADHTHPATDITSSTINAARLPAATASTQGAMSAGHKALLDTATYQNESNALVRRGNTGQIYVGTPTSGEAAATKSYVDGKTWSWSSDITGKPSTYPPSSHSHDLNSLSGTLTGNRISNITGGSTWMALSSGRGAIRIATDGEVYFQHDGNSIVGWDANGAMNRGTVPWSRITGEPGAYTPLYNSSVRRSDGSDRPHSYGPSSGTYYAVWVDGNHNFCRNTSSIKYKENVRDIEIDPDEVLKLRPVIYDRKPTEDDADGNKDEFGLIAEEVFEHVPEIVTFYDEEIDSVRYDLVGVTLIPVVQRQEAEIKELKSQVSDLTARLEALEKKDA